MNASEVLKLCRRRDADGICQIDGLPCFEPCEFFEPVGVDQSSAPVVTVEKKAGFAYG